MCVMIVNTRLASMALSASCMGALPRLSPFVLSSFRPFPCSSLQRQPSAFSLVPFCGRRTGRVLAWKHEIVPSIARSTSSLDSRLLARLELYSETSKTLPVGPRQQQESRPKLAAFYAATTSLVCTIAFPPQADDSRYCRSWLWLRPPDSTVIVSLSLEMTMILGAGLSSPEMAAE